MKRNTQIYETIMKDVSRIIKKHITEAEEAKTDVEIAADALIADFKKCNNTMSLESCIQLMKIVSKGHEKQMKYKEVSYDKLIPELESRLKEKSVNDNYKLRRRK